MHIDVLISSRWCKHKACPQPGEEVVVVMRIVCQSVLLLREKRKKKSLRRYIQSLISHCFSGFLSTFLCTRQWTTKERITFTLSALSFTLFQLQCVTHVLLSSRYISFSYSALQINASEKVSNLPW